MSKASSREPRRAPGHGRYGATPDPCDCFLGRCYRRLCPARRRRRRRRERDERPDERRPRGPLTDVAWHADDVHLGRAAP